MKKNKIYIVSEEEGLEYIYTKQYEENGIRHILKTSSTATWTKEWKDRVVANIFEPDSGDGVVAPKLGGHVDYSEIQYLAIVFGIINEQRLSGYKYLTKWNSKL